MTSDVEVGSLYLYVRGVEVPPTEVPGRWRIRALNEPCSLAITRNGFQVPITGCMRRAASAGGGWDIEVEPLVAIPLLMAALRETSEARRSP